MRGCAMLWALSGVRQCVGSTKDVHLALQDGRTTLTVTSHPASIQHPDAHSHRRFNRDLSGVHRDHALNFANIVEGYGPGYAATGVQYNRKQKVLSAELKTPQSMDRDTALQIRKIRGFGTARCQWCPTFVCWDLLESVVSSKLNREKQVRRFEIISRCISFGLFCCVWGGMAPSLPAGGPSVGSPKCRFKLLSSFSGDVDSFLEG